LNVKIEYLEVCMNPAAERDHGLHGKKTDDTEKRRRMRKCHELDGEETKDNTVNTYGLHGKTTGHTDKRRMTRKRG
jgi:hypothetical protein